MGLDWGLNREAKEYSRNMIARMRVLAVKFLSRSYISLFRIVLLVLGSKMWGYGVQDLSGTLFRG